MTVRFRLFGPLRDRLGPPAERPVVLAADATVERSLAVLGWLDRVRESRVAVAVNGELTGRAHALRDGDQVDLLPPVAGG